MKRLLWIGDAGVPSGFARCTHEILNALQFTYDITVLGINYRGDPHQYPYPIYTAFAGGDLFGVGRLLWLCDVAKPDIIVLQNDGWNIQPYLRELRKKKDDGSYEFPQFANIPVVGAVAVDGKNFDGRWLAGLSLTVFWTQFALDEARKGGFTGPAVVIPLGVDRSVYYPDDKIAARARRLPTVDPHTFIVGNVNRNQPRKRLDLTIRYFAEWVLSRSIRDAFLYLHVGPTGDTGVRVRQLMRYYGMQGRLALMEPPVFYGIPEDEMRDTYNCFDVQVTTTQGEGFGLTTFEGMACGVPQIVPEWSALGELAKDAACLVPCTSTAVGPPYINVLGGIADEQLFIQSLDRLYEDRECRQRYREAGLLRVREYSWDRIGDMWLEALPLALQQEQEVAS